MSTFNYKAYDDSGSIVEGNIEAQSIELAKQKIREQNYKLVSIKELTTGKSGFIFSNNVVPFEDLEFITAELSLLLQSGIKIDKALSVIAKAKNEGATANLLSSLLNDVRKGVSLSDAMKEHPKVFDSLYINLVEIGESTGNLSQVFKGLAQDLKYKKQLRNKILQASVYPAIILSVCLIAILFIFNFVIPKLTVMFDSMENLPVYTQILLSVSAAVQQYQLVAFIIIIGLVSWLIYSVKSGYFSTRFDEMLLSVPVVGEAIKVVERIRFCNSMTLMLNTGMKLDYAFNLSCSSVKNVLIKNHLAAANEKIRKGDSISSAMAGTTIFPNLLLSLVEVGEESGNMAAIFSEISERSRQEFSNWTDRLTSLIEPLMIVFMGGIVGTIVVVMLMSIVSVNDVNF